MSQPGVPPNTSNMMIKASQIDQLPFLDANAKQQYKNGLANLWHQYESNPDGSKEKSEAYDKIRTASQKLMAQFTSRGRPQSAGQPRPVSQQQQQQQQGNMQQQQQMAGQHPQQQQMSQQQQAQLQAQKQAQAQAQAQAQQQGQQGGQQQPSIKLSPKAQEELQSVQLSIPPDQVPRWRQQAFNVLLRRDQIWGQAHKLQQALQAAQNSGNSDAVAGLQKQFGDAKRAVDTANRSWKVVKLQGEGVNVTQAQTMVNGSQAAQQQAQAQAQQQQQQPQRPPTQQGPNQNQQQQSPADVKPAGQDPRTSMSPAQPQTGFQQSQQPSQPLKQQQNTPIQNQQQQHPSQPQQIQQQTPQSAMQNQAQQFQQQGNMQQQPQRPPQINTQQMQNQGQQQQSGGPQTAPPPSATQANQQRPQALSQQAAISQAADAYRSQAQGQQQAQQPPPMPNGLPFNSQPQSTSQQNTPTYPNLQTQTSSVNTKFPIPKTLALDPRTQTPQAGPAQRPTMQHAGMMYQPGVQRPPPYTLEGEGDRVLSKRKLDELVRQVTGAAPASSDSESSAVLSPDVEESILEMADNFVDELVTAACRLAKMRPNQTLDIRDIQIVLERNYGIRIPGYSLDEVRTVKKFQPAPGWQQKMQAVQAGKVMSSRDS